jgi:hypothetical protein
MARKARRIAKGKYRSAATGRYVKPGYAKRNPRTTVRESK